jgi:hypothetical protein
MSGECEAFDLRPLAGARAVRYQPEPNAQLPEAMECFDRPRQRDECRVAKFEVSIADQLAELRRVYAKRGNGLTSDLAPRFANLHPPLSVPLGIAPNDFSHAHNLAIERLDVETGMYFCCRHARLVPGVVLSPAVVEDRVVHIE